MSEPRARPRTTTRGALTFPLADLSALLYAFGDVPPASQLPSTLAVLDSVLTDFIIETCHSAALSASYARRQKLKVEDFAFALRRDERLRGRVLEQLWKEKVLRKERRAIDLDTVGGGGGGSGEAVGQLEGLVEQGGLGREMAKKGRRGRRKRLKEQVEEKKEA